MDINIHAWPEAKLSSVIMPHSICIYRIELDLG